jgi:hypothetical protein
MKKLKKTKAKLRPSEKIVGTGVPREALNKRRTKKLGNLKTKRKR